MTGQSFYEKPIINSPYGFPGRHWQLDESGIPTDEIIGTRRRSEFISPVPKPRNPPKGKGKGKQGELVLDEGGDLSDKDQEYTTSRVINEVRSYVGQWRNLPRPEDWMVTPQTARLLQHWRGHDFKGVRPFFCQIEAVETAIWLAEVAPRAGKRPRQIVEALKSANAEANPGLFRIALKLATGAGKTTVMAMLIAWQTVNAVRSPNSRLFTRGFLIVAPGITIRERLRVLQPNDPDSYYRTRELVPMDMRRDINAAKIVITNYHAFKHRERIHLSKGTRTALGGWQHEEVPTQETEGQVVQRVAGDLMGLSHVIVINDEAHHCYREKSESGVNEQKLTAEEKAEGKENNQAARLWISGIEAVKRKIGASAVYDLSATPFFLRGSGYAEGTLFPWTMSDFSLMDAIECGIVKLPRVPITDNMAAKDAPIYRELWKHVGKELPKKARGKQQLDPQKLPNLLISALKALYGHYEKTYRAWQEAGIDVPPVLIIVCQNTAISKLIYDYVAGFHREGPDGSETPVPGTCELFRNFEPDSDVAVRPRTLLIDSQQLESGEEIGKDFKALAAEEIERFRAEVAERDGAEAARRITDEDILREAMNTVGKKGRLGSGIRCVVSVSMLTEGWDANTVTHILGVRAFGTQLLCEQVVGRALRRQSYDLNEEGLFNAEYADILGIPFDFTAKPQVTKPAKPRETVHVHAIRPERDACEIRFPQVLGYRVELPDGRLEAHFSEDSVLTISPDFVGPVKTRNQGIIGEGVDLEINLPEASRRNNIAYELTKHIIYEKYREPGEPPKFNLFGKLKPIVRRWLDEGCLKTTGGTVPGQVLYPSIKDDAAEKIVAAIAASPGGTPRVKAVVDPYNPEGTTSHVSFNTSKEPRWQTDPRKCHVDWVVCVTATGRWSSAASLRPIRGSSPT